MQDPKETFNNIEHNTEMALLQSEKIAESVDNLEPIMEGVLVKADDILNEQKKTNELLSKEEEPKPEVQKIELLGAELITIKGKDGENGDKGEKGDKGDTGERGEKGEQGERGDIGKQGEKGEKGDNGDTGKDGIDGLDGKDGKNGKNGKDGSPDTPKQVKEKLLKVGLDYNEIDNTPDINKVINIAVAGVKQSSKTVSLVELDDIDYSGLSIVDGKYVLGGGTGGATWGSITGNIVDQTDLQNALNAKQDTITTGTTAQYFRGDLSLATFPTLVSSFTNDAGYITSSALSGYVPNTRTLTINGTAYDLSTDRTWSVGTVTSVAALTLGTSGTDISSSVATGTTTPVITLNVPTASALNRGALSSTDWSTFNSKESALTFSTGLTRTTNTITANLSTGVSGGQSVIGGTASGNNLTLSSTSHATKGKILFGTSAYDEVNNRLGIGTTTPVNLLSIVGNSSAYGGVAFNVKNSNVSGDTIFSLSSSNNRTLNVQVTGDSYAGNQKGAYLFTGGGLSNMTFMTDGDVSSGGSGYISFVTGGFTLATQERMRITSTGKIGIGQTSPTAVLHIKAGTATAGTAPLKLTTGTNLTTAEAGAMEFTTDNLYFTITTGAARKNVTLDEGLTSGRVPFATTNGRLTDDADMTFATDTLTVTKLVGTTSIKVGTVAGYISSDGSTGATGTFTTVDLKTVTVKDGIITSIV